MKKATKNWIATSDYDLETAESLLSAKRKIYVIFMCHLSIEKLLKAVFTEKRGKMPPYTHDLIYLAELCGITLPGRLRNFMELINDKSVPTRYLEDISALNKQFSLNQTRIYLRKTRVLIRWLKQNLLQVK